jgi:hypothetical protein
MSSPKKIIFAVTAFFTGLIPLFVLAQVTISVNVPGPQIASANNPCTTVINVYWFALFISGILAFGAIVWGGIKYALAAGNPSGQSEGKQWIQGALIGLLLLAGASLILGTINPALTHCSITGLSQLTAAPSGGGSGASSGSGGSSSGSSSAKCGSLAVMTTGGSTIASKIDAATVANCGMSSASGPGNGSVSCAWAVNKVLTSAGIANIDSTSVQSMENALQAGRGTLVSPSQAMPGDIVIQAQDGHVGICVNVGCSQVLSNSSSNASLTWISNTSFSPSYSGGPGRIYRVNG